MLSLLRRLLILFAVIVTAAVSTAFFLFFYYGRGLPDYQFLKDYSPPLATRLYANDYQVFKEYAFEKRFLKPLHEIPPRLVQAFLSAEDKNFYYHRGIDVGGLLRAVLVNTFKKKWHNRALGASTLTQQVAKNFLIGNEPSFKRKIKEAILALRLEFTFPKQRILEIYLNQVYLGRGSYGVAAAAQTYFGKDIKDLSWAECAFLAALPKAPTSYDPEREVKRITRRRNWVLQRLYEDGRISWAEVAEAQNAPLQVSKKVVNDLQADYFAEEVRRQLKPLLGPLDLLKAGLKVFTTLDPELQTIAQASLQQGLKSYDPSVQVPQISGAIIVMEAETGHVLALKGGFDYKENQFNCATQARRQPGSLFKPFVYLAALELGYTPETLLEDRPLKINLGDGLGVYQPKNISGKYYGLCPLRTGIEKSQNVMTVRLAQQIGMSSIQDIVKRLKVMDFMPANLAMVLGAGETTLLRLTTAYSMIVNGGKKISPTFLHKIEDYQGNVLYEPALPGEIVIQPEIAEAMRGMLTGVVQRGTGQKLRYLTQQYPLVLGGKTGTTNNCYDAWFIGFLQPMQGPTLVVGVFMGYLKPQTLGPQATGSQLALPVFEDFVKSFVKLKGIKPK